MKRILWVLLFGAMLALAAMVDANSANADEASYLNELDRRGMYISEAALPLGHSICSDILTNGTDGVQSQVMYGLGVGFGPDQVAIVMESAINELCPAAIPAAEAWKVEVRNGQR